MNNEITPPPELARQWVNEEDGILAEHIAIQAARWGADQELEACCAEIAWLESPSTAGKLRERRRPKPPSLKEQALAELDQIPTHDNEGRTVGVDVSIIRRALEQLDD